MSFRAGIDVGGTNARLYLFDEVLTPLAECRRRVRDASGPDEIASTLVDMLRATCSDADVAIDDVDSAGIGIAGQLSLDGRTVHNAPNLGWRDVEFAELLSTALEADDAVSDPPALQMVNDLNAQLWGEYIDGAVEGIDDVLAVYVGTGIGGAILSGGELVTGADANAGEIGHSKVVVGGRPCGCGENGCVEAYAGGLNLERRIAELVDDSNDPELDALHSDQGIDLSSADAMIEARHDVGDIFEEATDFLSLVIANATTLLNPSTLLIGGGVFDNCHNFRSMTLQKTVPIILEVARRNLSIERSEMGDFSGVLGAADLAYRHCVG